MTQLLPVDVTLEAAGVSVGHCRTENCTCNRAFLNLHGPDREIIAFVGLTTSNARQVGEMLIAAALQVEAGARQCAGNA